MNANHRCLEDEQKYYNDVELLKSTIITYHNFPKPGVTYKDAFSVLNYAETFKTTIDMFCDVIENLNADVIVALESRGFILAGAIAHKLNLPFVPVRKRNKLPGSVKRIEYSLHYGSDILEIQENALKPGQRVVILDDAVATGGSMKSTIELVRSLGSEVAHVLVIIGLKDLGWEKKLNDIPLTSLFSL